MVEVQGMEPLVVRHWSARPLCADHLDWVDEAYRSAGSAGARQLYELCRGCPIRFECWTAGLTERYGPWGGMSQQQRTRARNRGKGT